MFLIYIVEFTDIENIPGLLIFIDFQKAFDSIEWDFLLKCLKAFNFGQDFILSTFRYVGKSLDITPTFKNVTKIKIIPMKIISTKT